MPYRRKKSYRTRYRTTSINVLTLLIFAAIVWTAILLTPRAIEHLQDNVSGYGIDQGLK